MYSKSLTELIDQFVFYKKANGYQYQTGAYYLKKYARFVMETVPETVTPDKVSVEGFLEKFKDTPGSLYNAAAFLREFSRYLTARGIRAYLIPSGRLRLPTPVQPYFFTEGEIIAFFKECDRIMEDSHSKGRHLILPAIFRILYCCGLRCKEARTLSWENVHLDESYLDILQSKGPKSRRVHISEELAEYLTVYDRRISCLFPNRVTFFPNKEDRPYSASWLEQNFLRFWYAAFPEKKGSDISIRAYDFRHHFVYANMNRWMREGKDVNAMLPYLMRYTGHSDVKNTLYYFHLVSDIYGGILDRSRHSEMLIPEVDNGTEK